MKRLTFVALFITTSAFGQIQPEPGGVIETLPESWPAHWIIVQDGAFFHMNNGKYIVVDADSDNAAKRVKGSFDGSFISQFYQAKTRPEMYVSETFYSRGTRGVRTDVVTIYDKSTLAPTGEIVIPEKRASQMPMNYHIQLVDEEKFGLIYNFTPATSVSVLDMVGKAFLTEVPTPGCSLVYPMAGRAFASICTDGSMLSVQLDEEGKQASSARTDVFFDANGDALIEKAAMVDGVAYFPTFLGRMFPVDLNGETISVGDPWSLLGDGDEGWRPGGLSVTGTNAEGQIYMLMHPDGYEGSHKDPGAEVWIFDLESQRRVNRISLNLPAISIGLTHDDEPLMLATNINFEVDVYDATSGEYLRTLSGIGAETPFMLHGAN
jgi:methylamine dehydrogenase heavy chain